MKDFGKFKFAILKDRTLKVDGGSMFGIVPYVFWSKLFPPDTQNRIQLGLHSLYVQAPKYTVLIDPGGGLKLGNDYPYQEKSSLVEELNSHKIKPEDVDYIILTHLHTDHIEGLWSKKNDFLFPNSKIFIQETEWQVARNPSDFAKDNYSLELLHNLANLKNLHLISGEKMIDEGLFVSPSPGHTRGHQSVWIEDGKKKLFFPGDLIPTSAHVHLPYLSSFDLFPQETCQSKKNFLEKISHRDLVIFYHDLQIPLGRIISGSKKETWIVEAC